MLYIPSVSVLEEIEYNEITQEMTERRYSLLKPTELQVEFSKLEIKPSSNDNNNMKPRPSLVDTSANADPSEEGQNLVKVSVLVTNIDFKLTNKEMKELKIFSDKIIQYHEDLNAQVEEELIRLNMETQFRNLINQQAFFVHQHLE